MDRTVYYEAIKRIQTMSELSYQSRLLIEQIFKQGYDLGWSQGYKEVEENKVKEMVDFLEMTPAAQQMMVSFYKALLDLSLKFDEDKKVSTESLNKQYKADEQETVENKKIDDIIEESTKSNTSKDSAEKDK